MGLLRDVHVLAGMVNPYQLLEHVATLGKHAHVLVPARTSRQGWLRKGVFDAKRTLQSKLEEGLGQGRGGHRPFATSTYPEVQTSKSKEVKKNLDVPMSKEEEKFLKPTVLSNEKRKLNFKEKEELKTLEKKLAELEIIKLELG